MSDCIFCKIVAHEVPNYTVYEDDMVLAFLDIHPHAKGHTVVIPKAHTERTIDVSLADMEAVSRGISHAVARIKKVLQPDGFNIGWNDGEAAGQVVPHLHVHILPRWTGDGGGSMHAIIKKPGVHSAADIAKFFANPS